MKILSVYLSLLLLMFVPNLYGEETKFPWETIDSLIPMIESKETDVIAFSLCGIPVALVVPKEGRGNHVLFLGDPRARDIFMLFNTKHAQASGGKRGLPMINIGNENPATNCTGVTVKSLYKELR